MSFDYRAVAIKTTQYGLSKIEGHIMTRCFSALLNRGRVSSRNRSQLQRRARLSVEALETKQLLASSITLDPISHILNIVGSSTNDIATVSYATKPVSSNGVITATTDPTTIKVTLQADFGYEVNASFPTASVVSVKYNGNGGSDAFMNNTTLPSSSITTATGSVSSSLLLGSPNNNSAAQLDQLGVFTVGTTGKVGVDYLYDGAGYRGQLGMFSLQGMDQFVQGSPEFNKEAARRALSNSTLGHVVISVQTETAKFESNISWEGDFHDGHGEYQGVKTFAMTPGDKFAFLLVPNGLMKDVYNNPTIGGDHQPLYSLPAANPYKPTPQLRGQAGDLDGQGSLFAFEDLRLDQSSDKDYNDMTFQVTGARGVATPVSEVIRADRNFQTSKIFQSIAAYAASQEAADTSIVGNYRSGVNIVGASGTVGIDYLFDGGGYTGEMAIFSLTGMQNLKPGSPEFIKEAARRALSNSVLGHVVISDTTEGARTSSALTWEKDFNQGTYQGVKNVTMTPGDHFATMLVPAGSVWEVFNNASITDKKTPLFSIPEANPGGNDQLAAYGTSNNTFGFEDMRRDVTSDQDYNDLIYRLIGATSISPSIADLANAGKNLLLIAPSKVILA